MMKAAEKTCASGQPVHHEAGTFTPEKVLNAMLAADAMGMGRRGARKNQQARDL